MCYHSAHPGHDQLRKQFKSALISYESPEIFHVSGFARPYLPVTLSNAPEAITSARWKLLPFWVKTEADAQKYANTLNAEGKEEINSLIKPFEGDLASHAVYRVTGARGVDTNRPEIQNPI